MLFRSGVLVAPGPSLDLLALDEALTRLAALSPRQARVAELKLFAEMEVREMAFLLGVSERTVKGDWRLARAWLTHRLGTPSRPTEGQGGRGGGA